VSTSPVAAVIVWQCKAIFYGILFDDFFFDAVGISNEFFQVGVVFFSETALKFRN